MDGRTEGKFLFLLLIYLPFIHGAVLPSPSFPPPELPRFHLVPRQSAKRRKDISRRSQPNHPPFFALPKKGLLRGLFLSVNVGEMTLREINLFDKGLFKVSPFLVLPFLFRPQPLVIPIPEWPKPPKPTNHPLLSFLSSLLPFQDSGNQLCSRLTKVESIAILGAEGGRGKNGKSGSSFRSFFDAARESRR